MNEVTKTEPAFEPTKDTSEAMRKLFKKFNKGLFEGKLPNPQITSQRRGRSFGFFAKDRWGNGDGHTADEIGLNPTYVASREPILTWGELVHYMMHMSQHMDGTNGRRGYHNLAFSARMKEIGLLTTATGEIGGAPIGYRVTQIVIEGGAFDRLTRGMLVDDYNIPWLEVPEAKSGAEAQGGKEEKKPSKSGKHFKYECSNEECNVSQRGKDGCQIHCSTGHDITPMLQTTFPD